MGKSYDEVFDWVLGEAPGCPGAGADGDTAGAGRVLLFSGAAGGEQHHLHAPAVLFAGGGGLAGLRGEQEKEVVLCLLRGRLPVLDGPHAQLFPHRVHLAVHRRGQLPADYQLPHLHPVPDHLLPTGPGRAQEHLPGLCHRPGGGAAVYRPALGPGHAGVHLPGPVCGRAGMVLHPQRPERRGHPAGAHGAVVGPAHGEVPGLRRHGGAGLWAYVPHRDEIHLLLHLHRGGGLPVPLRPPVEEAVHRLWSHPAGAAGGGGPVPGPVPHGGAGAHDRLLPGGVHPAGGGEPEEQRRGRERD